MPESKKWLLTLQPSCIPIWKLSGMIDWRCFSQTMSPAFSQADMTLQHVTCDMYVLCQHWPQNETIQSQQVHSGMLLILHNNSWKLHPSGSISENTVWLRLWSLQFLGKLGTVVLDWLLDWIVTSCQSSKHAIASCHRKSRPSRLICACKKAAYDVRFTSIILVWYCQSFTKILYESMIDNDQIISNLWKANPPKSTKTIISQSGCSCGGKTPCSLRLSSVWQAPSLRMCLHFLLKNQPLQPNFYEKKLKSWS